MTPETEADGPALAVRRTTGRTVSTPGDRLVALERRRPEDRDQRAEVLADDDVRRDGVGGLVALACRERRAIGLGETGEREGEREERGCGARRAGGASERDAREARASPTRATRERAAERRQEPSSRHGGGEGNEPGQHEERDRGGAAGGEFVRVDGSAREDADCGERREQRRDIDGGDPPVSVAADRDGECDHARRHDRDREAEEKTLG